MEILVLHRREGHTNTTAMMTTYLCVGETRKPKQTVRMKTFTRIRCQGEREAARNERYYKRLSRDHEVEKLVLPLSPKQKHRVVHQTNSLPTSTPNTKTNYAPRYPNFQKISQPYYNMNSTYPLPQSVSSSSSSITRTLIPHSSRSAVVNRSRLSSSSTASSYPQNSTYPPQQNLSRLSSTSTLSHATSSNYPTFPPTDNNMRLVHAIPFKSVSYESNINNNYPKQIIHPGDVKSISYDNINQTQLSGGRKVPPNPPPRNPNRKTIALYEAPSLMVKINQNRHSSHQPYNYNIETDNFYQGDEMSKIPYKESYTGERAYLITQAHPNNMMNISDNFIRQEKSQNTSQLMGSQESIQPLVVNQSYFHHKDNPQVRSDSFYPDSRYTNNDRLNEPNQYNMQQPNTGNTNVQFYSATSKVISSSPKVSPGKSWNHNGEQLYENTPAIRAHISSQQNKRPSSISPSDSQFNKRSFTDQNAPDSHSLLKTQRLTRSNETLPYDENLSRINEIGIPIHPGFSNGLQKVRVPSIKRPLKGRQSLEIKETVRPLSIVLEKSENELESDRISYITSSNSFKLRDNKKPKEVKLNENGLRITSNSKNLMGSASNLDDALTELEQIYESLNLNNDEDLLDRAERRDLPICYQINKDQVRDTPEVEEINRILGNPNIPNRTHSTRKIGIPNKVNDDMAIRKYRYQNENSVNTSNSETGSYLLTSPTLSPPPFFEDKPASPVVDVDGEPDVTRDDVVYRNTKYVNNLLKPHDPQPFGIPLRPVINASSTDYLHVTPDTEKYRSTFHSSKTPDVVTDDLAYRNLRKDYNKDCNTLQNFHLIPAFRSERDRNSSPYSDKDKYLSNLDYEERFQRRKKRAMRSLSGNLFMRDYHANESDPIPNEYLRPNVPSNVVRSQTTSPEYHLTLRSPIQESDFERLKDRWLNTPSPEDMEKLRNRDKSALTYINKNNSTTNKKIDSILKNNTESLLRESSEDVNIISGVENLRKKFVISKTSDRSNPFKKMLNDDFDITPEIESIRKKFVHDKIKSELKNPKSIKESEKTLKETGYKNNFKNIKNQFNSELTKTRVNRDSNEKISETHEKKNEPKKVTKANRSNKENPFVSKFENIRSIFSARTNEEEVQELIKPKKKIKKFRETNNNSFVSSNDYYDYKSNMDRSIDCLKKRAQVEDSNHSKFDDGHEDTSVSDSSQTESSKDCSYTTSEKLATNNIYFEQKLDDSNPMCKDDELLQQLAKETTETSEQINQKLRQLSSNIVQHKTIKLNQFPITLEDDANVENNMNSEKDTKIDKQSILKSVQTVSIESEYDNIPRSSDVVDKFENETNHEEALCFDDLDIPHDTNTYEKLDYTKLVKVKSSGEKEENCRTEIKPLERHPTGKALKDNYTKQISITSEYDNVPFNNQESVRQSVSVSTNKVPTQTVNKSKEILVKQIDATKFTTDDDNEPFVSLTMKNVPPEDLESTTTSDNEVVISELSDEGLNSQDMDLINNYFQNGKTINTVGIKISEIKNLNFESDSSFNSEIQNIFSPQTKSNFDEDGTDSEIENLPIDLQIEILENKSISSLDNDSNTEDFQRNLTLTDENKDKYSLELEKTLDTGLTSETRSESLRTLCQSPVEQVESQTNNKHVVENSNVESSNDKTVEPETFVTNDIRPDDDDDGLKTNLSHTKDSNTNPNETLLCKEDYIEDELDAATISSGDLPLEKPTIEADINPAVTSPILKESIVAPKLKDNDDEVKAVATLEEPSQLCDNRIVRSKSNENVRQTNGKLKSPSEKHQHESPIPHKPANGFGKCCSSSSSSNLDLYSSEGSSKSSSNQCRDLTPVRRRRSLPESPVKLSLSSMCAHLTRPEGTSYNMIAAIFIMLALYIAYARGLHIVTLLAFISLACIFYS
ncbi:hypothetical protein WDU94_006303 [Cyamophila willieti]